ncbi:epoxide hydrolase [Solimonas sp. K1W22B-7]|uniref:epoxide hydrolase family protein n=1 Tax=Solimonas sp. K1W22B-7 TaxID=2303331 RepID=UPI000E337DBF|nr:epoxide hydrolase family protein [Solimonas sp. K1W22B-7]AXQ27745.1 epoxide hydrolase [Solimonas sp. K1W22B-7]
MSQPPVPFRFEFPPAAVAELRQRLARTRWPDELEGEDSAAGLPLDQARALVEYWREGFDFAAAEARLNRYPQYRIDIDGLDLHYVHIRSPHAHARPLLMTHGWPGSVLEFFEAAPRLTEPERYGGDAADAFHLVLPSLQGYGGSPPARKPGMSPRQIGRRQARLMQELGYERYVLQGGDWGSVVSHYIAVDDARHVDGLHLNMVTFAPPRDLAAAMKQVRPQELAWLAAAEAHRRDGMGYYRQQSTRPQTLAYALTDSPAGWCAWIGEKYGGWSDGATVDRDTLLTQVSLYWFTDSIASGIRLYREFAQSLQRKEPPGKVTVPTGFACYPNEIVRMPRAWCEAAYPLIHWSEPPRGGHFAALEQPRLFAEDLWAYARKLRAHEQER